MPIQILIADLKEGSKISTIREHVDKSGDNVLVGVPEDRPTLLVALTDAPLSLTDKFSPAIASVKKAVTVSGYPKSVSDLTSSRPILEIVQVIVNTATTTPDAYMDTVHTIFSDSSDHMVAAADGEDTEIFTTLASWNDIQAAKDSKERPEAVKARGALREMCKGFVVHAQVNLQ